MFNSYFPQCLSVHLSLLAFFPPSGWTRGFLKQVTNEGKITNNKLLRVHSWPKLSKKKFLQEQL